MELQTAENFVLSLNMTLVFRLDLPRPPLQVLPRDILKYLLKKFSDKKLKTKFKIYIHNKN